MDKRATVDLVIVTGPHRSGTTFVGSVVAAAEGTVALGVEPLNPNWGLRGVSEWYPDIREGDDVDRLLQRLRAGRGMRWRTHGDGVIERLHAYRRAVRRNRRVAQAGRDGTVVVLKDPFLSLSLGYATRLTPRPVIAVVRHPAAWAMSLRRVGWHPGGFLASVPSRELLVPLAAELGLPDRNWEEAPLFEAAAWAWCILVGAVVSQSGQLGNSARVLPLERFADDPVEEGLTLIEELGLVAGPRSKRMIEELTLGTTAVPGDATTHVLHRDTKASLNAWRSRLGDEDQTLIWRIAEPVASRYYEA